ncbi:unnamed protein product (macronuclear) [Paramecium tetraurelia]|uniref:Uncharacterized protein n=1 Tax=Paramecium tetraurelia TaxID=5888 RepID=A0D6P0_PARTE|nr:uncharacterized protein GSPATT00001748001 [Paramecium tetraurelia]CAK78707.1 unnamed protein product [Paramecium tetraurelia]|eukprot:XP_001446104.1 hypothetical protein (macronuclear) [Paramecium tetraurelia strain d4-2]
MSTKKQVSGGKTSRSNSKQSVSNPISVRKRFSSLCSPPNSQGQSSCVFCQKFKSKKVETYAPLLNKALFAKYSSSQNYYYSKDINDIIDEESTPAVVFYRDLECIVEEEEYLKRSYAKKESTSKIKALLEYYKYHKDIPRLFMQKVYITINKFHEKKRRIEYANIKRRLNIPDEDIQQSQKKEKKKKQQHSDEDVTVGQLKHLLKDLKLDTNSYLQKKVDISSSVQLREFVQQIGQKYDYLGQISGLLSIDQSNSFLLRSQDLSTINKNLKQNYLINNKPQTNQNSKAQILDSKTTHQISYQGSFDKININRLQFINQGEVSSIKAENSIKAGEQTKRSNQDSSPMRNSSQLQTIQKVYSQIEGFASLVQKQQQSQQQQQKLNYGQKSNSQRKVSANFNSTDCQFRLPSRQNSTQKQPPELQSYQVNFLQIYIDNLFVEEPEWRPNYKNMMMIIRQPLATDRIQRQSVYNVGEKNQQKSSSKNIQKVPQKFNQYALATLRNLQVKYSEVKKKQIVNNNNMQGPILNSQLLHYRTKSQDAVGTYKASPPKQPLRQDNSKDPLRITNNINVQGSSKKVGGVYNINQNNIVNIYIEDLKSSAKIKQGGSQTARINSPLKNNPKGIFEIYNTQRSNQSPASKKIG